jgi:parallel beta-helix repeat protein
MNTKSIIVGIVLFFFSINLYPIVTCSYIGKLNASHSLDFGTLSGYIRDKDMNPLEGAKIIVYFHDSYEENYSDSNGYYHVTNIPICFCLKNATVYKEGYHSEWILLPIGENTFHNFTLKPVNKKLFVGGLGPNNYSRIQDAIDNASTGNTIFVYNGIYFENIIIDKSIELIGENKVTTIIDADGNCDVISIFADGVYISGFTIINSGISEYPFYEYQSIFIDSDNNKIIGNIIYNSEQGINLNSSYGNIISENIIDKCNSHGIYQYRSNNNELTNNSIFNFNYSGISLIISDNNKLSHNSISYSSNYGYGIILSNSKNNTVSKNSFFKNRYGIELRQSEENYIIRNNFIENKRSAKFYALLPGSNNNWDGNYWYQSRLIPKLIFGSYYFENSRVWIHWFNIDWHPAKELYDIRSC